MLIFVLLVVCLLHVEYLDIVSGVKMVFCAHSTDRNFSVSCSVILKSKLTTNSNKKVVRCTLNNKLSREDLVFGTHGYSFGLFDSTVELSVMHPRKDLHLFHFSDMADTRIKGQLPSEIFSELSREIPVPYFSPKTSNIQPSVLRKDWHKKVVCWLVRKFPSDSKMEIRRKLGWVCVNHRIYQQTISFNAIKQSVAEWKRIQSRRDLFRNMIFSNGKRWTRTKNGEYVDEDGQFMSTMFVDGKVMSEDEYAYYIQEYDQYYDDHSVGDNFSICSESTVDSDWMYEKKKGVDYSFLDDGEIIEGEGQALGDWIPDIPALNAILADVQGAVKAISDFIQGSEIAKMIGFSGDKALTASMIIVDFIYVVTHECWGMLPTLVVRILQAFGVVETVLKEAVQAVQSRFPKQGIVEGEGQAFNVQKDLLTIIVSLVGTIVTGKLCTDKQVSAISGLLRLNSLVQQAVPDAGVILSSVFKIIPDCVKNWAVYIIPSAWFYKESLPGGKIAELCAFFEPLQLIDGMSRIAADPVMQDKVLAMADILQEVVEYLSKNSITLTNVQNALLVRLFTTAHKALDIVDSTCHCGMTRASPFCIYLYGGSGVAKSSVASTIIADMTPSEMRGPGVVYSRNAAMDHWDGYYNQFAVLLEEFGATDEIKSDKDPYMDFLLMKSCAPYQLAAAHLIDKGKKMFTSRLIVATSNTSHPRPKGMQSEPIWRRRDVLVEVAVKDEYRLGTGRMLDGIKVKRELNGDVTKALRFSLMKATVAYVEGEPREWIDYDEFMKVCVERWNRHWEIEGARIKYFYNILSRPPMVAAPIMFDALIPEGLKQENEARINEFLAEMRLPEFLCTRTYKDWISDAQRKAESAQILHAQNLQNFRIRNGLLVTGDGQMCDADEPVTLSVEALSPAINNFSMHLPTVRDVEVSHTTHIEFIHSNMWNWISRRCLTPAVKEILWKPMRKLIELCRWVWNGEFLNGKFGMMLQFAGILTGVWSIFKIYQIHTRFHTGRKNFLQGLARDRNHKNSCNHTSDEDGSSDEEGQFKIYEQRQRHQRGLKVKSTRRTTAAEGQGKDMNANGLAYSLANHNMVEMSTGSYFMRGLGVKGTYILAPRHFFDNNCSGIQKGDVIDIRTFDGTVYPVIFDPEKVVKGGIISVGGHQSDRDFVLYDCGLQMKSFKDITKCFILESDLEFIRTFDAMLLLSRWGQESGGEFPGTAMFNMRQGKGSAIDHKCYQYKMGEIPEEFNIRVGWTYAMETFKGDCGAPLMILDVCQARKILGIHVMGVKGQSCGVSELVTQEDLQDMYDTMEKRFGKPVILGEGHIGYSMAKMPEGNFSHIGILPSPQCVRQPVKTKFERTPLFDQVFPHVTEPAVLSHRDPRLKVHHSNVAVSGTEKYGKPSTTWNAEHLSEVVEDMKMLFHTLEFDHKGVLTDEQAIAGIDGIEFFDSINLQSSPGWPYVWSRPLGSKGKEYLFSRDESGRPNKMIDLLAIKRYYEREEKARRGERMDSLWTVCLKDETRPIEKIELGKTRVFTMAPVDFTLAFRKHFLSFSAFFYKNRLKTFSAVGINPWSLEWTTLANILLSNSIWIFDADIGNFDGEVAAQLVEAMLDVCNSWYECESIERKVYIHEIIHCLQLLLNLIIQTSHGNPSGNPFTVIINTIVNCMMHRVAWLDITKTSMREFHEHVKDFYYGDDLIISVSDKYKDVYNGLTLQKYFAEKGIKYGPAAKNGVMKPYSLIGETQFLKCGFRLEGQIWKSPMAEDTINESTNWCSKSKYYSASAMMQDNINDALRLLYMAGEEKFNQFRNKVLQVAMRNKIYLQLDTYRTYDLLWKIQCEVDVAKPVRVQRHNEPQI